MALLEGPTPIETDDHVLRARRTAAVTRVTTGVSGVALVVGMPHVLPHPALGIIGFLVIVLTAAVQLAAPGLSWLKAEESLSTIAGLLIIGLGSERVTVLTVLWLVAVASGVLARGGRVHWFGRAVVLCVLALPPVRYEHLGAEYAAMLVGTMGLLLTSGRLTSELNHLLRQARLQAENAETLLLAGDIAARVADRETAAPQPLPVFNDLSAPARPSDEEIAALARLVEGEGITMVVQPIVDVRAANTIHAYEALARFSDSPPGVSPLHWFSLAEQTGQREALERACLAKGLELFTQRPPGTLLSVNLSAPVLMDPLTQAILDRRWGHGERDLDGLIVEITEETLVHTEGELKNVIGPLIARGARLAVDDMGAGYSGLRQITTVRPAYLKLDRSLITDIDGDDERAALIGALAGYANKVGSLLVAEGVETEAELDVVRSLAVPLIQGYYFSRPAPPWPTLTTPGVLAPPMHREPTVTAVATAAAATAAAAAAAEQGESTSTEILVPTA
jgi:EAL domain-containing protein (putative c-di-GMP-specific phosphodiesterase class I)